MVKSEDLVHCVYQQWRDLLQSAVAMKISSSLTKRLRGGEWKLENPRFCYSSDQVIMCLYPERIRARTRSPNILITFYFKKNGWAFWVLNRLAIILPLHVKKTVIIKQQLQKVVQQLKDWEMFMLFKIAHYCYASFFFASLNDSW